MAEVVDRRGGERALRPFEVEPVRAEDVEDRAQVSEMLRPGGAVDQDVVEEDEDKATEEGSQHIVHQCLKCCRGIAEAERHDKELIESVMGSERHLRHVPRVHAHLVVP